MEAKGSMDFKGIKIGNFFYLSHLLFVDDILIFYDGTRRDVIKLREIIDLYYTSIGMMINIGKSIVSFKGIYEEERLFFSQMFPYNQIEMEDGLKYLVFS
jgi:hypothetical protein